MSDRGASWRKNDEVKTRRCGCVGQPRRRCDLCDPARAVFLACSAKCIAEHRRSQHADRAADAGARLAASQGELNRRRLGPELYAHHRARVARLVSALQRGEGLCVLGAGNCDDLDLPLLVRDFGRVHLVDVDGDALAAAAAAQAPSVRDKLALHAGIDLSGTAALIDRWGDDYPREPELQAFAGELAARVRSAVDAECDVVLSACLLSQLYLPLRESLVLGLPDWQRLFAAIERAHLLTIATLTRPGGSGVLALDVTSSHKVPELLAHVAPESWDTVADVAARAMAARQIGFDPDPDRLLRLLAEPPLAALAERPRVTEPWVWQVAPDVAALVKALVFTRP